MMPVVLALAAGLSVEQAGVLAELFAGQWCLLPDRRRANACDLIKFVKRYSADAVLWEQLCAVRMIGDPCYPR